MESWPLGARTLDCLETPWMGLSADAAVAQNKLPSELGKTPATLAFRVTIRACTARAPKPNAPTRMPAAKLAIWEDFMGVDFSWG